MSHPEPDVVFRMQQQQLGEYEDGVQHQATLLLRACRSGSVLEALQVMGCSHCHMLVSQIVAAVEEGPEHFLASLPKDKEPVVRAAMGADDAKIPDLLLDIAASM